MNKVVKWISNYWYHYKLRTILCLFFAVVVGVSVFEFATRESYDMKVYLYMSETADYGAIRHQYCGNKTHFDGTTPNRIH